ncbi:MAG: hypothetical protein II388_01225 [Clostridia bacterium]|nr:hypothetical protein [Clostridia bacterium]
MNTIKTEISIDFNENRSLKVVRLKQNDTALRHIVVALSHNGVAVQLDSSEETAKVNVSVNGVAVVVNNNCTVYDNKVEFDVTEQMTTLAGEGICDIKIMKNSFTIYTASFRLLIEPSAVSTDTPEIVPTTDFVKNFAEQTQLDWAAYILNAFEGMHPEYDKTIITQTVEEMSSFTSDTPFYIISSSVFTSDVDGLFICLNDKLILRSEYSFDHTIPNTTRIYFDATKVSFSVGDTVKFFIYKKPSGSSGIVGAAYPSISSMSTDSVSGLVEE